MKTLKKMLALGFMATMSVTSLSGCLLMEDDGETSTPASNNWHPTSPESEAELHGTYISGHLGNYWDCPDQAYTPADQQVVGAPGAEGADFAPCEQSDDSCGGPLNCESAMVMIELSNPGELKAQGVSVYEIELLDVQGTVLATLPIVSVAEVTSGASFDGELEIDEQVKLRVEYQGPLNLRELLPQDPTDGVDRFSGEASAKVRIKVKADNAHEISVESKLISSVPSVAT